MFFSHLAIEKALKAHVARVTGQVPPRIHNLVRLAEIAGVTFGPDRHNLLREFGVYQLEGRYPDTAQAALDLETASRDLAAAEEMVAWLTAQL